MTLSACGLNHKTAPIALREKLAFAPNEVATPLTTIHSRGLASEVALLSTCNRTEFYCEGLDNEDMLSYLAECRAIDKSDLAKHFYFYSDEACVRHMMRVACGLDSLVLGEPQILGQMKQAFKLASETGTLGPRLQRLFQYVFTSSKHIRTESAVGAHPISVAYVAVNLAKRIFSALAQTTVLLIGAGETVELAAKHLHDNGVGNIIVANRTVSRAKELAARYQGRGIAIADIPTVIEQADIIVTATASPLPLIGKGMIERALKARRHKPMLVLDLAMPRDVEVEVGDLSDVFLYCVDDLQQVIADNLSDRQLAAKQADEIINLHTSHFMCWLRSLDSVSLIRDYRAQCQQLRDKEVDKALAAIRAGESVDEAVKSLGRALTNKIMHQPTTAIRQAAYDGELEKLAVIKDVFEV